MNKCSKSPIELVALFFPPAIQPPLLEAVFSSEVCFFYEIGNKTLPPKYD
jgi:hypothetical protein